MKEKTKEKQKGKKLLEKGRSTGIFIHDPDPDRISAFVCISDVVFPLLCIL